MLASAQAELQTTYSQKQTSDHSDDSGSQLATAHLHLQSALASSQSALAASEAQLKAANERIQQLELSADATNKQLSAALGPNGVSQLHTGFHGSNATVSHSTDDVVQVTQ